MEYTAAARAPDPNGGGSGNFFLTEEWRKKMEDCELFNAEDGVGGVYLQPPVEVNNLGTGTDS